MLKKITQQFSQIIKNVRNSGRITEDNIDPILREVRVCLLEADIALPIVNEFIAHVKETIIGEKIQLGLSPDKVFVKVAYDELARLMGESNAMLNLKASPTVVLACGLQGVGKTTNLAKIANLLKTKHKKRVLLASLDIYRPSAIEQLDILAQQVKVPCYRSDVLDDVHRRAQDILPTAKRTIADVVLIDTAGRTTLDTAMMDEIAALSQNLQPQENLFFLDAMQGQSALETARAFHEQINLTGLVLTKLDGDSRGGALVSARYVTHCPVKFIGVGENIGDIQSFHPDRMASRILGMGDMMSLVEEAQEKISQQSIRDMSRKLKKPATFNLNDYLEQIRQTKNMGNISGILDKLPSGLSDKLKQNEIDESLLRRTEGLILSMTREERAYPDIIKSSRKKRIAGGAGATVNDLNIVLSQFFRTQKMLKKYAKNPAGMMRMMQELMGR